MRQSPRNCTSAKGRSRCTCTVSTTNSISTAASHCCATLRTKGSSNPPVRSLPIYIERYRKIYLPLDCHPVCILLKRGCEGDTGIHLQAASPALSGCCPRRAGTGDGHYP